MQLKHKQNRFLALLLSMMMLLSLVPTLKAEAAFNDISGHWAETAIRRWSEDYGLILGYDDGTFRPDRSITRGAFAGILNRFMHYQTASPDDTFTDIEGNYWKGDILALHAAGVYLGNNGKALPQDTITRQQALTMVARAFSITADSIGLPWADSDQIAAYAQLPLTELAMRGYITDSPTYFRPTEPITRAEFLNLLNNMVSVLLQTSETWSRDVKGSLMINASGGAVLDHIDVYGDLIIAPGVTGTVTLKEVFVHGSIKNFGTAQLQTVYDIPVPQVVEPETAPVTASEPEQPPETAPVEQKTEGETTAGETTPGETTTGETTERESTEGETPEVTETAPPPGIQPSEVYTPSALTREKVSYNGKYYSIEEGTLKNRLGAGDFEWDDDRLRYLGDRYDVEFGIDVSAYQNRESENTTIDWEKVKNDGVDFAFIRVGFRGTSAKGSLNADAFYGKNITGAMNAGIRTGVYFFAQAITVEEAIEEAEFVIELLKDYDFDGPVCYDWEMGTAKYRVYGTPPEMATACAVAFCERIEEAGYDAMVYAGTYVSYIKYDMGALSRWPLWYPEYKTANSTALYPQLWYRMEYWQFTDSCHIEGIGGRVDANLRFY